MTTPVVHVVDDDDSFRTAVTRLLKAAGYEVRGYASAGEFLLARADDRPGCVVLDVNLPGPSGLDLQAALVDRAGALPIIFLTGHGDVPMCARAMKAGAEDFLTKPVEREQLLNAVRNALDRDAGKRKSDQQASDVQARHQTLTLREQEVLALVVAGKPNKHIATELGISERTVKAHRAQVMEKMRVDSLADLIRTAAHLPGPKSSS